MKILIVGSDEIYAIENFYYRHLQDAGFSVKLYPAQKFFYQFYQKSIVNKLAYRLGVSSIIRSINQTLSDWVEDYKPDVLWVFKGMEIIPGTLKKFAAAGIKLVNYNPDNPFIFSGPGSGNRNVTEAIPFFDLHFTYNLQIEQQLKSLGLKTAFLPFAFENSAEVASIFEEDEEQLKFCFVGNPDKGRAAIIQELVSEGIDIDIYGHHWNRFIDHPKAHQKNAVYSTSLLRVLRSYRLHLNIMRIHNEDSHNMRTFEVPGIGGIMLAPSTTEHSMFFEHGREAFFFKNLTQAAGIIKEVLNFTKAEANNVRTAARTRSINSGYTYRHRAVVAGEEMQKLF